MFPPVKKRPSTVVLVDCCANFSFGSEKKKKTFTKTKNIMDRRLVF